MGRPTQDTKFLQQGQMICQKHGGQHCRQSRKRCQTVWQMVSQYELIRIVGSTEGGVGDIQEVVLGYKSKIA